MTYTSDAGYALKHLGVQKRCVTEVKSMSGTMLWKCTDGRLTETGEHSYQFRLTGQDTLALCNLLVDNYPEIVQRARAEQRAWEDEHVQGGKADIPYY